MKMNVHQKLCWFIMNSKKSRVSWIDVQPSWTGNCLMDTVCTKFIINLHRCTKATATNNQEIAATVTLNTIDHFILSIWYFSIKELLWFCKQFELSFDTLPMHWERRDMNKSIHQASSSNHAKSRGSRNKRRDLGRVNFSQHGRRDHGYSHWLTLSQQLHKPLFHSLVMLRNGSPTTIGCCVAINFVGSGYVWAMAYDLNEYLTSWISWSVFGRILFSIYRPQIDQALSRN